MKELRRNMRVIMAVLMILFIGAGAWFGATVYTQGDSWASNVYNPRLERTSSQRGDITDRDGVTLATTNAEGKREYLSNDTARRALSQTVGDTAGMSGAGVESFFSSTLLDLSTSLTDRLSEVFNSARHVGSSIQITVDAELQTNIAAMFPKGYNGAVCVTNYRTGEILAMVSMPNYDPYSLNNSEEGVADTAYLNRCLQGLYTPGSIFKIVTLAGALDYDPNVVNQAFTCSGVWDYEGGDIVCMSGRTAHGDINLKKAFTKSCNVTFGKLAYQLGIQRLKETAEGFGFNENFKFGDFVVYNSSFPQNVHNMNSLVWAGIGQGEVLVTPLHMAMITGSVANGGAMMQPYLVKEISTSLDQVTRKGESKVYRQVMRPETARTIAEYMYETVRSGTAGNAAIRGYTVCGKTGSAETSNDKTKATNAWYTGFVYDDKHPYAISVVIEEGGSGGDLAAKLAGKALALAIEKAD
ncbi:MAG: penicillin-binding protein 2 [Clostridia bacterium]|nr:penicillin-binding protein 2 [Clostridia bacterium]